MSKSKQRPEHWKDEPDEHDFPAAVDYLSLLFPVSVAETIVEDLRRAGTIRRQAKDLMRASGLELLPEDDPEVRRDLKKVEHGERLSPALLVRGRAGRPLIVADGYHRVCASFHLDETAAISCRLVDAPDGKKGER